ncbi:ATPase/histidine kinase/DNA gyrase B/HSP90 domain protein, partial [Ostertagia ostertagi]
LQITEQKVQVELDVNEDIFVHADEQHLRAVFVNLLDNALKYSGEKCLVKIIVRKEANIAIVKFRDNGIGIDEANQRRIFEKFYRVQSGNLHDVKGFGLGLSYVKSIVEAHGGHIEVKSELGKGTYFSTVTTNFKQLNLIENDRCVAINGTAEFIRDGKRVAYVSSCDVYEFDMNNRILTINSYCITERPEKR